MKTTELSNFLKTYKIGTYTKLKKQKCFDTPEGLVQKITDIHCRIGIEWKNTKAYKEQMELNKGKPKKTKVFTDKIIIDNILFENANGEQKIRLYPTKCKNHKTKNIYILNGKIVEKQYLLDKGYIKESNYKEPSMITPFLKDIISIG